MRSRPIPAKLLRDLAAAPILPDDDPAFSEDESGSPGAALRARSMEAVLRARNMELTPKEAEVLWLLSHGFEQREAAAALFKSYETITSQMRGARATLRARNTTHAVGLALRGGLIH